MIYNLVVNPEAQSDLAEAIAYYDGQREGLGREFADAIEEVFAAIQSNPLLFAPSRKSARLTLARRFPYVICYRIVDREVRVIAVFHSRRGSRAWTSRLRNSL